ncbi:hypothetical protein MRS44_002050 [Fusarium solani]|uniref:uncharacterized protein n=1 Tax=Fusarium solani TaxID=169388 RepID=UPI0032C3DADC|nr:hypothetical protein MRS44_002050 [Fusarium solani]
MKSSTSVLAWAAALLAASPAVEVVAMETCCASLEAAGLNVYYPDSTGYKTRTQSYFSVSSQLQPYCIVQPETAKDVSVIVKTLAYDTKCNFAIRSGGHTVWAANNINDGVTIDLGLMNKTTYVKKTKPFGVTAAGGRTSTVGVAGFLTGGGNTVYTARRRFDCDLVDNFEVVLADGRIANANKDSNSDLWKALKGGSANFGIVTRFDVSDIPFWSYTPQVGEIGITVSYEDTIGVVAPKALEDFWKIPYETSNLRKDTHRSMTVELELVAGYRNVWFAITFKNELALYKKALGLHKQSVGDFICHAIFQAIPTVFSQHSLERGGNVVGLDRETDNAVMFQVQLMINGVEQEKIARERMVRFRKTIKQYSVDQGGAVDWEYLNYADFTQDLLSTYGPENVEYIRKVAKKYDPKGILQTRLPGGFKISKVA